MADLPPPSYDDAIIGNYSAPRPIHNPEGYRMSELGPSDPSLSEKEPMSPSTELRQQESTENDLSSEPDLNQQGFFKRHLVTTWKLLIIGALVGLLILFYLLFISPKSPSVQKDCTIGPPNFSRGTWRHCWSYEHGARCELVCDKNYRFYIEDNYYTGSVYFVCDNDKWISPAATPTPCKTWDLDYDRSKTTCGRCLRRPPGPDDCKGGPPDISAGSYYGCPNDDPTSPFFSGTWCNFRCNGDGVIERPRRKCLNARAPDNAEKMTGLTRCDDSHNVPPATSGYYTCRRGKWVSSFPEIGEANKTIECIAPPLSPGSCGMEPPKISKATWIDCQERREFRNGEKCNFKCNENLILSSSKMDGNYEKEGSYNCIHGEWKSSLDESNENLECLTITEFES